MNSAATDQSIMRQQLTQILGHEIDDPSWELLEALPVGTICAELIWRVEALLPQVPAQGTLFFHPLRPQSGDAAPSDSCFLCGNPLPATGRFRCDFCAIAAQLVLEQPVQYVGVTIPAARASASTTGEDVAGSEWIS